MADLRSDHALSRAMDLLTMADPVTHDDDGLRLRELAVRYIEEAERLHDEPQHASRSYEEPLEVISSELDNVARGYFEHALRRD